MLAVKCTSCSNFSRKRNVGSVHPSFVPVPCYASSTKTLASTTAPYPRNYADVLKTDQNHLVLPFKADGCVNSATATISTNLISTFYSHLEISSHLMILALEDFEPRGQFSFCLSCVPRLPTWRS